MQLTFACLSIVAFIASANAQRYDDGGCPSVKSLPNLDLNAFTKPLWYQHTAYDHPSFKGASCVTIKYTPAPNGGYILTRNQFKNGKPESIAENVNYLGDGKFQLESAPGKEKFMIRNYEILATDYTNYAVGYNCAAASGNRHASTLVILTTSPNPPQSVLDSAKKSIAAAGLPTDNMIVIDKSKC